MKVDQTIEIELIPEPQGALSNCLHYTKFFFLHFFIVSYVYKKNLCVYTGEIPQRWHYYPGGGGGGGGGYSHIVWVGVCRWVRESPTLYYTKYCKFCDLIPD